MNILVTGGAGYIGSHTCLELLNAGHNVIVVDNLSNSKYEALRRVQELTSRSLRFYKVDLLDRSALEASIASAVEVAGPIDATIHFAGLKAVGESVAMPLEYYHNNLTGTLHLIQVMEAQNIHRLVFSSSATVYGPDNPCPLREDMPRAATNPYGRTKLMIEEMLIDLQAANPDWEIALLRYFNPVGAHPSGMIGEDPVGIPNNLLPYVAQVAVGRLDNLGVFGDDYPTPDGTCIRDYIHVMDLSAGHLKALEWLEGHPGAHIFNLGTGQGRSVLEVVQAFEAAIGRPIPQRVVERRPGDLPVSYADPSKANRVLGWQAQRSLAEICADMWRWQSQNPLGYR
jgi:UDP-glucose 4-epimerase